MKCYSELLKVNNNGLLSFSIAVSTYTPRSFPLPEEDDRQLIAPYWADVDTREAGTVWFRAVNDSSLLNRIGRDVRASVDDASSFQPKSALIVTWESVGYYSAHYDLVSPCLSCSLAFPSQLYEKLGGCTVGTRLLLKTTTLARMS